MGGGPIDGMDNSPQARSRVVFTPRSGPLIGGPDRGIFFKGSQIEGFSNFYFGQSDM